MNKIKMKKEKMVLISLVTFLLAICALLVAEPSLAASDDLGSVAARVTGSFANLAKMITATSYIAGMGFAIGAVLKFKAHKDNPTQIPVGTPIALMFIAAALIFLPTIFGVVGQTLFGTTTGVGGVQGVEQF